MNETSQKFTLIIYYIQLTSINVIESSNTPTVCNSRIEFQKKKKFHSKFRCQCNKCKFKFKDDDDDERMVNFKIFQIEFNSRHPFFLNSPDKKKDR